MRPQILGGRSFVHENNTTSLVIRQDYLVFDVSWNKGGWVMRPPTFSDLYKKQELTLTLKRGSPGISRLSLTLTFFIFNH